MSGFTSTIFSASQAEPPVSETPVSSPPSVPLVTLRRVGPPNPSFDQTQVQQYIDLLTGVSDTVTLSHVEVVATAQIEPTHNLLASQLPESQTEVDRMDIDGKHTNKNQPVTPTPEGVDAVTVSLGQEETTVPVEMPLAQSPFEFDHAMLLIGMNGENTPDISPYSDTPPLRPYEPAPFPVPQGVPFDGPVSRATRASPLLPPDWNEPNERQVYCQACRENVRKPIFITCGHAYCKECLNRLVRTGTVNRGSWPPRCCGAIDVEAVQNHLDEDILIRYVTVAEEFGNRNPIYCANKTCSHYFEQSRVSSKEGKFIQCTECDTRTCTECKQNSVEHIGANSTDCKEVQDLMTQEDQKLARSKRWRQCPGCRNLVERIDGCSHMSCECGIDFCYDCGSRRDAFTTACSCRSRANQHRWQPAADGDNMPRRMARRVLDSQIIPIPRRLRTTGRSNPPDTATRTQLDQPTAVVPPATPNTRTNPQAPGVPEIPRVDPSPSVGLSRPRQSLSLNPRHQAVRTDTGGETRSGTPSSITTASTNPATSTQARPTQTPENGTSKKPVERTLRPRLRPQYDNSRPLFPVTQGPTVRNPPAFIQPSPPRRQPTTVRPTETKTNFNEDIYLRPLITRDKRGHSPDPATQRRLARPSWNTASPVGGFLSSSLARSVASGISTNVHQQAPSPQP